MKEYYVSKPSDKLECGHHVVRYFTETDRDDALKVAGAELCSRDDAIERAGSYENIALKCLGVHTKRDEA
jgi:hypothetical protein